MSHFTYFTSSLGRVKQRISYAQKGTQMVHKIFIYISMMGFLLRMKNYQVQRKALRVNGRDNGFVYALGHQILNGVAAHASVPYHLLFLLAVDKYPYL